MAVFHKLGDKSVDRHPFESGEVGEEGHELSGLGLAIMRREGGLRLLLEERDAVRAPAPVADGVFHFDPGGVGAIPEENLDGERD